MDAQINVRTQITLDLGITETQVFFNLFKVITEASEKQLRNIVVVSEDDEFRLVDDDYHLLQLKQIAGSIVTQMEVC